MKRLRKLRRKQTLGEWNADNPTPLDNLAYKLYCEYIVEYNKTCELFDDKLFIRQWHFVNEKSEDFKEFYIKANMVLRKDKLKNVNKRIQTKSN